MVVEVVLPALEPEGFTGSDVLGEIVKVGGLGGDQIVGIDGFLVEVIVGLDRSDFLREMVMREILEDFVFLHKESAVKRIGIREEDEAVPVGLELFDDFPHGVVGREDVLPGLGVILRAEVAL